MDRNSINTAFELSMVIWAFATFFCVVSKITGATDYVTIEATKAMWDSLIILILSKMVFFGNVGIFPLIEEK